MRIIVDTEKLDTSAKCIMDYLLSNSLDHFVEVVRDRLVNGRENGCVSILSATTVADDHVIIFGVSGKIKVIASACLAGDYNAVCCHVDSL